MSNDKRRLPEWQQEMVDCVGDDLIQQIVRDNKKSVSLPGAPAESPKGSGWVEEVPLKPPPGVAVLDQLMDEQDRRDRAELERVIEETEKRRGK